MRIRFFNTFEPVNSFYRDVLPFLVEHGVTVEVIVSRAEYRAGRVPLHVSVEHPHIQVNYVPVGKIPTGSVLRKVWINFTYMVGAVILSLFGRGKDLNFFLTQPPLFPIWGYVLRVIRRQRYCVLVMDLYPDVAVQAGLLESTALSTRLLTVGSRFVLKQADIVIVIGRCMQEYLQREGVTCKHIHVIPNWSLETEVYPISHGDNQLRRELGLKDEFIVLYSGNIGVSHFFDDILEVARRLQAITDLYFVFIGDGIRVKEIEQAKETHHLNNVLLLPFQPVERLAHSISMGNVHFISLRPGFEGLVVPSKAYGALAAGRPIIYQGSPQGEIARMIVEEQVGSVLSPHDPDTLERTILDYYQNPAIVADRGKNAYELSKGRYRRKHSLERYGALLIGPLIDTANQI